jgi:hypothetical protein
VLLAVHPIELRKCSAVPLLPAAKDSLRPHRQAALCPSEHQPLLDAGWLVAARRDGGTASAALALARSGWCAAGGLAHALGCLHALAARDGARGADADAADSTHGCD